MRASKLVPFVFITKMIYSLSLWLETLRHFIDEGLAAIIKLLLLFQILLVGFLHDLACIHVLVDCDMLVSPSSSPNGTSIYDICLSLLLLLRGPYDFLLFFRSWMLKWLYRGLVLAWLLGKLNLFVSKATIAVTLDLDWLIWLDAFFWIGTLLIVLMKRLGQPNGGARRCLRHLGWQNLPWAAPAGFHELSDRTGFSYGEFFQTGVLVLLTCGSLASNRKLVTAFFASRTCKKDLDSLVLFTLFVWKSWL